MVHGIRNLLQYQSWVVRVNIYVGGGRIAFTKRFYLNWVWKSIFKFEATSNRSPSNLNAEIIFYIFEVLGACY